MACLIKTVIVSGHASGYGKRKRSRIRKKLCVRWERKTARNGFRDPEGKDCNENIALKVTWWDDVASRNAAPKRWMDSPGVIQLLSNAFSVGNFSPFNSAFSRTSFASFAVLKRLLRC